MSQDESHNSTHSFSSVYRLEQTFSATIQSMLTELSEGWSESDTARLQMLWQEIEQTLILLSDADQLRLAGNLIVRLSELCHAKAERWLGDWEVQHNQTEPPWDEQLLVGLVQKTMYLDLSDLIRTKPKASRSKLPADSQSGSMVGAIDKKKLLKALDIIETQESTKQQALAVAHDEDVSAWIEAIDQWISKQLGEGSDEGSGEGSEPRDVTHPLPVPSQEVWFSQLCQELCRENSRMTTVKVFLALLLGGYSLEQSGGFYTSDILIRWRNS